MAMALGALFAAFLATVVAPALEPRGRRVAPLLIRRTPPRPR